MASIFTQLGNFSNSLAGIQQNLGINTLYNIIFQVIAARKDASGNLITKEIEVQPLAVLPSEIGYLLPNRATVTQTPGGSWKDSYGMGLTQVTISGTFGVRQRLVGGIMKDGYRRMIEFKERIMKWSNTNLKNIDPNPDTLSQMDILLVERLGDWGTLDNIVFYLNFYDFYQNEYFSIDLKSMQIIESTQRNNLPMYTLSLMQLGELIKTISYDPVLISLLFVRDTMAEIQSVFESVEGVAAPFIGGIQAGSIVSTGLIAGISRTLPSVISLFTGAAVRAALNVPPQVSVLGLGKIGSEFSTITGV